MTLFLFAILSFFYQQSHAGFASAFLFMFFILLTVYEGMAFMTMFYKLQAERWIEKRRLYAGQAQQITIKITRKLPIPFVWYAVYDPWIGQFSGMPGQMFFPWFRKEWEVTYEVPEMTRGRYTLTQLNIVSGDLFGLIKRTKTYSIPDHFLVLPSVGPLTKWSAEGGQRNGLSSASKRIAEELTSIVSVRDYQQGDRLSQIHWKASARGQGLKTKEFEHRTANHFAMILDTHRLAYSTKEFEQAVRLTASFAHFGYHQRMKYSVWYDQKGEVIAKEGSHSDDFHRIMEELAVIQREGETSFVSVVQYALTRIPKGTHLVLITTKLDPAISRQLMELSVKKWKVEVCLVSKPSTPNEREWIHKMQGSGVNCYREMA